MGHFWKVKTKCFVVVAAATAATAAAAAAAALSSHLPFLSFFLTFFLPKIIAITMEVRNCDFDRSVQSPLHSSAALPLLVRPTPFGRAGFTN